MGHKSGFYLFIGSTGELNYNPERLLFYELEASFCSDMNVQGFELLDKKKRDVAGLQGVIMVRPGVKGEGAISS